MRIFITAILFFVTHSVNSQTIKVIEGDTVRTEVKYFVSGKKLQLKKPPTCITKQGDTLNLDFYLEQNFVYPEEERQACNYDRATFKVYMNKKSLIDSISYVQPFLCYHGNKSKAQLQALLNNIKKIRLEKAMKEIYIQLVVDVKAKPPEPMPEIKTRRIER